MTRPGVLAMDAGPADSLESAPESRESPEHRTLLLAARAGSREAFGELIQIHERAVFRAALAALGTREDAEDAAQEAFVLAWRKLDGFRAESSFRTWLLTIVWRKALDKRRGRLLWWKRTTPPAWQDGDDTLAGFSTGEPDPERAAIAVDLAKVVRREIARLSPTLRDTLLLAASGEHSYQDIASMLGAPLGTIKWRVAEARRIIGKRVDLLQSRKVRRS
jgi:RNA polymerase sigma-70 factor (ECF subfamily)